METGTAAEQMVLRYETQCKLCLIAKTYLSYAPKTTNQGVYRNKVWSCTEFARLLHKIRFFFLGQMNVLLWTPSKSTYIYLHTYLIVSVPTTYVPMFDEKVEVARYLARLDSLGNLSGLWNTNNRSLSRIQRVFFDPRKNSCKDL